MARIGISANELYYKFLRFGVTGLLIFVMKDMENLKEIDIFHYYLTEKGNIPKAS